MRNRRGTCVQTPHHVAYDISTGFLAVVVGGIGCSDIIVVEPTTGTISGALHSLSGTVVGLVGKNNGDRCLQGILTLRLSAWERFVLVASNGGENDGGGTIRLLQLQKKNAVSDISWCACMWCL